jgi:hypothetical protein
VQCARARQTQHASSLAPSGLSPLLEVTLPAESVERPAPLRRGHPPHSPHGNRESSLGARSASAVRLLKLGIAVAKRTVQRYLSRGSHYAARRPAVVHLPSSAKPSAPSRTTTRPATSSSPSATTRRHGARAARCTRCWRRPWKPPHRARRQRRSAGVQPGDPPPPVRLLPRTLRVG